MTPFERAVAALQEVNPPVAAALEAAGTGPDGLPLPGYLGWMSEPDRQDLVRACFLASLPGQPYSCTVAEMVARLPTGTWCNLRGPYDHDAVVRSVAAWARAKALSGPTLLQDVHLRQRFHQERNL